MRGLVWRGRVARLGHAVVAGDDDERDAGLAEPVECFEDRCVGFGLGFDGVEEVAGLDYGGGSGVDDIVDAAEEVIVDLSLS